MAERIKNFMIILLMITVSAVGAEAQNQLRGMLQRQQQGSSGSSQSNSNSTQGKNGARGIMSQSEGGSSVNNHDYVDLGLPSGTLWATCNIGASRPEECGDYFAWAEISTKPSYYSSSCLTEGKNIRDFAGNSTYDAATVHWGSRWQTPTLQQAEELIRNTTSAWVTVNGVKGLRLTSKRNGNSIFLPASGFKGGEVYSLDIYASYWLSTQINGDLSNANLMVASSGGDMSTGVDERRRGHTIRPVLAR